MTNKFRGLVAEIKPKFYLNASMYCGNVFSNTTIIQRAKKDMGSKKEIDGTMEQVLFRKPTKFLTMNMVLIFLLAPYH